MAKNDTIAEFIFSRGTFFLLSVSALVVGGVPVLLSILAPQLNNSVVIAICASGQFFVSIFAGIAWSKTEAVQEANLRWVPMAASACDRLATILGSVANLRATVGQACANATKNLPELTLDNNRAMRVHFEGLCSSNATRLSDVESHLDSALTDWERFIKQNCNGPECADIGRRLALLRSRLQSITSAAGSVGCSASTNDINHHRADVPSIAHKLELLVSGVSANTSRNGRWVLQEIETGFWECEPYVVRLDSHGWYVEDRNDESSYFYRAGASSPCGVYERCEVCPHDGKAVVFAPVNTLSSSPVDDQQGKTSRTQASANGAVVAMNLTMALSEYVQHVIRDHNVSRDAVITAITECSDMAEFSAMLGTSCPGIVSVCAVPALNVMRDAVGRPALAFDEALHKKLCEEAPSHGEDRDDGTIGGDKNMQQQVA